MKLQYVVVPLQLRALACPSTGSGEPAAWYFIIIVYRLFALQGEQTIHKEWKILGKRKS